MVNWPTSRRPRPEAPRLRPRVAPTELSRIDFTEFTPEPVAFLGQAAYVQLEIFENLARAVSTAPELGAKEGLSATAGVALRRHHELIAELRRLGAEPAKVMAPFAPALDRFRQATSGADWYELLLGIHITSGMLDDYFVRLAEGLPHELRGRIRAILGGPRSSEVIEQELVRAVEADHTLDDRLALWGRSLVGDTLLIARSAIRSGSGGHAADVEPVFTELIAEHTRRMDALGLTA
ncbi:ferritin-like fold-containing protein [Agromyces marinus]|uniref:ferritin-like fold-containing protein n=1 Tax=Agromyces marinus TaxID=1389020 RepID=UPI001F29D38E|nr:ferritin-like fold-containing protein [Agromyces marinus]